MGCHPKTQWAPGTIDPSESQDRSIQIFKLQPVFPFRLNADWIVLIRTIFRFVSSPTADPVIGLSPGRLPAQLWVSSKQQGRSFRHKPHCCSRSQSGPELEGWSWFICCLASRGSGHWQREGFSRFCFLAFYQRGSWTHGCATSGFWQEIPSAMTSTGWLFVVCCVISWTAAGI